jgi:hypothetical protein
VARLRTVTFALFVAVLLAVLFVVTVVADWR